MSDETVTGNAELAPETLRDLGPARLLVRVRSVVGEAEDINAYEIVRPDGSPLPPFAPGSHIDLYFRDQRVRQYSLCGDPADTRRYWFAVQREPQGRGGSNAIFERVHVGRILAISEPRNHFPLHSDARRHLLLAGGIGITPMVSMIHLPAPDWGRFHAALLQRARRKERRSTEALGELVADDRAAIHHDGGDPARGLDIAGTLEDYAAGTHLYYCGPRGFMAAVAAASAHWPRGTTHYEYFVPAPDQHAPASPTDGDIAGAIGVGFQVKAARERSHVRRARRQVDRPGPARARHRVATRPCESGLRGTCRTRHLEGEPEHRDLILDDQERRYEVLICCARSHSPLLVLDI